MTKNVALSDSIIEKLNILKKERNESYSQVISSLLESTYDVDLNEINEYFRKLKQLIPQFRDSLEIMRVICVRFYRLSESEKMSKIGDINSILQESFNNIIKRMAE
jgi:predicted CopG family antitoxin